ncbi:MAG: hypothetical protein JRJ59_03935 [Deltaproteobacteria bacterium]|nr:hypothetical protein [Deltaproteobacteria bacterium]
MTCFEPRPQTLDKIFKARSVALVGASENPAKFVAGVLKEAAGLGAGRG